MSVIDTPHSNGLMEVSILFNKNVVRYIGEQRYYHGFVSEEKAGDYYRMKFLTAHLEGLGRWLLMFTNSVKIESPSQLRDIMNDLIEKLKQQHGNEELKMKNEK
jgi:predicted DNA-binding transcriptional regulator YafY